MENVKALPAGSLAAGWKLYACPATTEVAGVPPMRGASGAAGAVTVIVSAASEAREVPLLTVMTMFE